MLSRVLSYIDSLFYTTTITTTVRTTTTTYRTQKIDTGSTDDLDVHKTESSVTLDGDNFIINGKTVPIPFIVKNRKPAITEGLVNHDTFPHYMKIPILMLISEPQVDESIKYQMYCDEVRLSRNTQYNGYTQNTLKKKIYWAGGVIANNDPDDGITTATVEYGSVTLSLSYNKDWIHLGLYAGDQLIVDLHHENKNILTSDTECIIAAYAYTRALIINAYKTYPEILDLNEDDFATTLLAMMMVERV